MCVIHSPSLCLLFPRLSRVVFSYSLPTTYILQLYQASYERGPTQRLAQRIFVKYNHQILKFFIRTPLSPILYSSNPKRDVFIFSKQPKTPYKVNKPFHSHHHVSSLATALFNLHNLTKDPKSLPHQLKTSSFLHLQIFKVWHISQALNLLFSLSNFLLYKEQLGSNMNGWAQIIKDQSSTSQNHEKTSMLTPNIETSYVVPQVCTFSKKGLREKQNTKKVLYNWNKMEDRKYIEFLKKNKQFFSLSAYDRKCIKINVIMSRKIKSRTAAQCHTHHQKMMRKFGTIDNIIHSYHLLIEQKHLNPSVLPLGQVLLKENQSCINKQPQDDDAVEEFGINKQPYWLRYVELFSAGERQDFHEESPQD